jgi:hypothetical protein
MVGSCKGILYKKVGEDLAQHMTNERIFRYKLEIYHNFFLKFVYGSPISIETSRQNEEAPNGTAQEEDIWTKEPQELRGGSLEEKEPHIT